jgi:3-oxoacyl-[acyl-carrier protein] reductase
MLSLEGKTALVTGASQGIGEAIARLLAAQGAKVVLGARNEDRLAALAGEIEAAGGSALAWPLDLAAPETIAGRLGELPEGFHEIGILVNNAGITDDNLFARMSLQQWQRVLDINLTGTFAVTRALVRGMMRLRWGRIITVSSVVGLMGNAGQTNYAASKAALIGFTKSLAKEFGGRNMTANVVAPGFIETAMTEALPQATRDEMASAIVLKRLGTCQDVANVVAFLASEEAGYITGETINVSGGLYM